VIWHTTLEQVNLNRFNLRTCTEDDVLKQPVKQSEYNAYVETTVTSKQRNLYRLPTQEELEQRLQVHASLRFNYGLIWKELHLVATN